MLDELERCSNGLDESFTKKIIWQVLRGIEFCHTNNVSIIKQIRKIAGHSAYISKKYPAMGNHLLLESRVRVPFFACVQQNVATHFPKALHRRSTQCISLLNHLKYMHVVYKGYVLTSYLKKVNTIYFSVQLFNSETGNWVSNI